MGGDITGCRIGGEDVAEYRRGALGNYRAGVTRLAEENSDQFINNSQIDYVAIVMEEFFDRADGVVCLVTDSLNPLLYGRKDVKRAIERFLQKEEASLHIIAQFNKKSVKSLSLGGDNDFLISLKKEKSIYLYHADKQWKNINGFMVTKRNVSNKYAAWYQIDIKDHINTATFNAGDNGKKLFEACLEKIMSQTVKKITIRKIDDEAREILI